MIPSRLGRLLPILAGIAAAAGQAPLSLPFVALAGFAATVWLVSRAPDARATMFRAWGAGAGYFAGSLFWIVEPFLVDAERHGWMAPFALAGLAGGLALFWGAAGWAAHWMGRGPGGRALAFVGLMGLVGLARGYVLTGFPWALPGHVWADTPLAQFAALAGAQGL
ncbi:MAG: apolipoprotein N-acyltransferase, partial [Alphaproteobacteria bacterium HGW-Alphaproteobacteria-2]